MSKQSEGEKKIVARNRRAFFDFLIVEQIEAGLVLQGTEVKSLREGRVSLEEAHAKVRDGEALLIGLNIPPYAHGTYSNHVPDRTRRLLRHRREIVKLESKTNVERLTIIPLELYFRRGFAKVLLGVARGKKLHDKRQSIRAREDKRAMDRRGKE